MSLYKSLLEYESVQGISFLEHLASLSPSLSFVVQQEGLKMLNSDFLTNQFLLQAAYILGESSIKESDINALFEEINKFNKEYLKLSLVGERTSSARKNWIKTKVEFYQKFVPLEGKIHNLKDAVRKIFKDESDFKKAIQPVLYSEGMLYDAMIRFSGIPFFQSDFFKDYAFATLEIRKMISDKSARDLFS